MKILNRINVRQNIMLTYYYKDYAKPTICSLSDYVNCGVGQSMVSTCYVNPGVSFGKNCNLEKTGVGSRKQHPFFKFFLKSLTKNL